MESCDFWHKLGAATQPSGVKNPSTSRHEHQFTIQLIITSFPIQTTVRRQEPEDWLPDNPFKQVTSHPIRTTVSDDLQGFPLPDVSFKQLAENDFFRNALNETI